MHRNREGRKKVIGTVDGKREKVIEMSSDPESRKKKENCEREIIQLYIAQTNSMTECDSIRKY